MNNTMMKKDIPLPDRQLAATPIRSPEGQDYLAAMAAAANYAWVNRQVIMSLAENAFLKALDTSPAELRFSLVYDVILHFCDVVADVVKMEDHVVDGKKRRVCVI